MTIEKPATKFDEGTLYDAFIRFRAHNEQAPLLDYFNQFKSKFTLDESFKVKGNLCEFYYMDVVSKSSGYSTVYAIVLSDGKIAFADRSNICGNIRTAFDNLIGVKEFVYHSGCPHYSFKNPSAIEIIKTDRRFLEFHKMYKSRQKGNPLKSEDVQIPNTVYSIGRPIMYRTGKDGKNEFFYDNCYRILKYDVEYNLSLEKRFNTRFFVAEGKTKVQAIDRLLVELEKQKKMEVEGSWNHGNMPFIWCEPNPVEADKFQKIIDSVKLFRGGL